ncbi:hypothetical protein M8C21_006163 [Ambrosia artemisiifolia]|uniref:Exocyst complex component EXO84C n=1 Tax=Ambrosia artemisiifolia TaxID=4212 RepID=A0AAD5C1L7_AMBAR|nr:hypothetical protein M8C21_006163 [Ambrosia artemisiifolia]
MSSSEEEDDFPCIESVTPQSKIDTIYQSKTEKGIRKLCFELLDLKDAVENLCGNTRTKLSEEVVEMEHEMNELRKNISAQGILVQDLLTGVYHELGEWSRANPDLLNPEQPKKENEENAPSSETVSALRAASICVQASLNHCSALESQGLKLSKDIVDQLTRLVILHFGGNVLARILQLFDQYMDELIKALPEPSEDDSLVELKEAVPFRAETDSQQLALLGTAFTIAEELLPMVMSKIWSVLNETKDAAENGDWRKQLQHPLDKLRDHFCRQYVLNFIYSRDGNTRLDAHIYLSGESDDLNWNSDPLPSLPFQALFGKLQQLATVAGDVLLGKEKIQKVLLARLTETVVMWLMSNDEDFWGVLENQVSKLHPQGLQQLILDMHFTVEIARFAGYPSRNVQQVASSIIARAIRTFSSGGLNQQSVLPEDEWFVETAKAAINKLLLGGDDGSEISEVDEEHIILHDDDDDDDDDGELHDEVISDSDRSPSSLSTITTSESFASAESQMLDSLSDFSDPDS